MFISHTGSDEGAKVFAVSVLKQALDNTGMGTFLDIHDLPPGCKWPEELVAAAAHSAVFVAVLVRRPGLIAGGQQAKHGQADSAQLHPMTKFRYNSFLF